MKNRTVSSEKAKKQRRRTVIYLYMLFVLLSLFVGVSYTWFTITRTPKVSNMNIYINSNPGMELSMDMEKWDLQLNFWDVINYTDPLNEEKDKPVLRPITWSEENQCFYAAAYGIDGRLKNYREWLVLNDERNANKQNIENYYIKATFYVRSGMNTEVTLSPAVEVNEGVAGSGTYVRGLPIWNPGHWETREETDEDGNVIELEELVGMGHENGGQGAENAIRFGFRTTVLKMDENGEYVPEEEIPPNFIIFEPNSDAHINGFEGYIPTASVDGTEDLLPPEKIFLQSKSFWEESDPIEHGVVIHTLGEFIDREGEIIEPQNLFDIEVGKVIKVELYIWLEGQDIDCTNQSSDAKIEANIQFSGKTEDHSGLTKIE